MTGSVQVPMQLPKKFSTYLFSIIGDSSRIRCWSLESLDFPIVALGSPRQDCVIQKRMDLALTSNSQPAAIGLRGCLVISLMAYFLDSFVNKRRGIRFTETLNNLIKNDQLAIPQNRV